MPCQPYKVHASRHRSGATEAIVRRERTEDVDVVRKGRVDKVDEVARLVPAHVSLDDGNLRERRVESRQEVGSGEAVHLRRGRARAPEASATAPPSAKLAKRLAVDEDEKRRQVGEVGEWSEDSRAQLEGLVAELRHQIQLVDENRQIFLESCSEGEA